MYGNTFKNIYKSERHKIFLQFSSSSHLLISILWLFFRKL